MISVKPKRGVFQSWCSTIHRITGRPHDVQKTLKSQQRIAGMVVDQWN